MGIKGLPEAAKKKTTDGAIAFVKFYVDVVNEVGRNPRVGVVAGLSSPACSVCARWEDSAGYYVRHGERIAGDQLPRGTGWTLEADLIAQQPSAAHVGVSFPEAEIKVMNSSGQESIQQTDAAREVFLLEWTESGWQVSDVERAA